MLAKQAWLLMGRLESLCARVIRGKYFHDKDFLMATRKRNSSHIWKAILHGRESLKKGLTKRVDDGTSINVWDDPWIPSHIKKTPVVRLPDSEVVKVNELLCSDSGQWNMEKIDETFVEPDISAICSIPVGRFINDVCGWDPEKRGNFTVRVCYKLLATQNNGPAQESSSGDRADRYR
jgi:hypothetical protein